MKFIKILFVLSAFVLFSQFCLAIDFANQYKIEVDLDNDNNEEMILVSPSNIKIYKIEKNRMSSLADEIALKEIELSRFNQYDVINIWSEIVFGQEITSAFSPQYDINRIRYHYTQNRFSRDKFIIMDINKDGLYDFIRIEEPTVDNRGFYRHLIYYQDKNCFFSKEPNKVVDTMRSSWITGIYCDINRDSFPDKIEIKYKRYGALLSKIRSTIAIHFMDSEKNIYNDRPDMYIVSKGLFYEEINFRDIDNNGYPDIVILDIPKRPKSLSDAISKILDRNIEATFKFYLYKEGKYPSTPSFVKNINIDILQDLFISLDNDFNDDGYNDLLIEQLNRSEKYIFDSQKLNFTIFD